MGELDATSRQFVTFGVGDELFAVPLTQVHEIIRFPDTVGVPLGRPSLEGVANLRGLVLPVLSMRCMLELEAVEHDDATRVVVLNIAGRAVGLVVDRVANVVTVEDDRIAPATAFRAALDAELLCGFIKGLGAKLVMILDVASLIAREFPLTQGGTSQREEHSASGGAASAARERSDDEEIGLVSFMVAGGEYALPIERVAEIVHVPALITGVPNCGAHVLGVMTLRDRLLPLVSLRQIFDLPAVELTEAHKIVVVAFADGSPVGLVMDSVREVLRVNPATIETLSAILGGVNGAGKITAICRLADGARLVSILSAEALLDVAERNSLHDASPAAAAVAAGGGADDEEQLVVFRIMDEDYAVPIAAVQEIVRVPAELNRIPNTPDFIEGVVNLRGAVLPVIDQRRRFGLPTAERNDGQRIVVFAIRGVLTGFIVDSVSQVMRVGAASIGAAPRLGTGPASPIERIVNLVGQRRMILMLEVDRLLDLSESDSVEAAAA